MTYPVTLKRELMVPLKCEFLRNFIVFLRDLTIIITKIAANYKIKIV
jgi:hypothetical protein